MKIPNTLLYYLNTKLNFIFRYWIASKFSLVHTWLFSSKALYFHKNMWSLKETHTNKYWDFLLTFKAALANTRRQYQTWMQPVFLKQCTYRPLGSACTFFQRAEVWCSLRNKTKTFQCAFPSIVHVLREGKKLFTNLFFLYFLFFKTYDLTVAVLTHSPYLFCWNFSFRKKKVHRVQSSEKAVSVLDL